MFAWIFLACIVLQKKRMYWKKKFANAEFLLVAENSGELFSVNGKVMTRNIEIIACHKAN